jgi:hypothetical protein
MPFRFAILALLAAFPLAAQAADYMSEGIFTLQPDPAPTSADDQAKLQLKCALHFFQNRKDGTFEQFFLDRDQFLKDGTVSYLEANVGVCTMDDKTRLESCQSKFAVDGKVADEPPSFNFYSRLEPDTLTAYSFTAADDFAKWQKAGSDPKQGSWSQTRCKDLTAAMLKPHLSQVINPLSQDESNKRMFYNDDPTADDYAMAKKVMDVLKK